MAQATESVPDTADAVVTEARRLRRAADDAEVALLLLACDWADLHPPVDPADDALDDPALPGIDWRATAGFALAVNLSDDAGTRLIHQALELRHRMPRVWERLRAGELTAWRARRVADATIGHPDDVAADVDEHVALIAHRVGLITLAKLVDEAMMRLYPEEREQDQLDRLDRRRVVLHDDISHNGVGHMTIDADLKDLTDFDRMVSLVAQALKEQGCPDSLDVRRAVAIGVLADPAHAQALLDTAPMPRPGKEIVLHLHLSDAAVSGAAVAGADLVGRSDTHGRALLEQQIREWCGRTDTHLTVRPVRDQQDHERVDAYEASERLKELVDERDGGCVFPFCGRRPRRCDHDHAVEHARGGATCPCNIAPLCRRHHRLKTHTRWRYTVIEPGVYLWASPWGGAFLRDGTGTRDVTPRTAGDGTDDGCRVGEGPRGVDPPGDPPR